MNGHNLSKVVASSPGDVICIERHYVVAAHAFLPFPCRQNEVHLVSFLQIHFEPAFEPNDLDGDSK